jgi:hypothetical protein
MEDLDRLAIDDCRLKIHGLAIDDCRFGLAIADCIADCASRLWIVDYRLLSGSRNDRSCQSAFHNGIDSRQSVNPHSSIIND